MTNLKRDLDQVLQMFGVIVSARQLEQLATWIDHLADERKKALAAGSPVEAPRARRMSGGHPHSGLMAP